MKSQFIILMSLLLIPTITFSQESENKADIIRKNAVSFSILGITPVFGFTYERLLAQKISIEAGIGIPSVGIGVKIFPFTIKENKLSFHTGISLTYVTIGSTLIYIPFGFSYFGKRKFNFGIDIGPVRNILKGSNIAPYGNIKFGIRF